MSAGEQCTQELLLCVCFSSLAQLAQLELRALLQNPPALQGSLLHILGTETNLRNNNLLGVTDKGASTKAQTLVNTNLTQFINNGVQGAARPGQSPGKATW